MMHKANIPHFSSKINHSTGFMEVVIYWYEFAHVIMVDPKLMKYNPEFLSDRINTALGEMSEMIYRKHLRETIKKVRKKYEKEA